MRQREGRKQRSNIEPRAYLREILNVLPGVISRTKIIRGLGDEWKSATKISKEIGLSYKVVNYHLRLMENEKIVTRKSKRPRIWHLTGLGQQRITNNNS
jgi:predicted transcriptional regulator